MRIKFRVRCRLRLVVTVFIILVLGWPQAAAAQGLLDRLFGSFRRTTVETPAPPAAFANPLELFGNIPLAPPPFAEGGRQSTYCVRLCDGRFFPVQAGGHATPVQMCEAFCPASATKVFAGSAIERAVDQDGRRYTQLPTAYRYRDKLMAECTCNGRDPLGLAPMDLSLDTTLRPGDIVATTEGLVAYTGGGQSLAEFTPVNSFPGLSPQVRAKLENMKVTPSGATEDTSTLPELITGSIPQPKSAAIR